ncbi:Integrase core domain protein [compost metagenome]|uniref:Integrase catalytic domain-containing protein n=1 Tax=Pseudomonas fluorescens TaxID=294 RepID=A0A5E7RPG1_PSEFL|nr:DDE-type integrase/transposase/recombinase [Pseudomonas fluorescens]VVP75388.1 hypothetical protein PS938_00172 [Pseudomonas fluorescens]
MNSLPMWPGAQHALHQDIHEIITADPTQIVLGSIKSKHSVFIPHDTFCALQVNGERTLHQQVPIDKSLTSFLANLNTKQSKDVQRKTYCLRSLGKKQQGSLPEDSEFGGRMEELVLDNGLETANQMIQNIAATLGFKLSYGPPGCPDVKARIERFFGALKINLIHATPGTTYSNREMKNNYNSDKKNLPHLRKTNGY